MWFPISTLEIIFCVFLAMLTELSFEHWLGLIPLSWMAENYFVKVLIPLKGVLKRVQLVWAWIGIDYCEVKAQFRKLAGNCSASSYP